ncbi:MAG: chemotaxis protein CheW [Stellaceae bacterium]
MAEKWLVCRAGSRLCAVPLASVVETMRALPIEPLTGGPHAVVGLCMIRGAPVPVVDVAALFGDERCAAARLVTLSVAGRRVALALAAIVGIRAFATADSGPLPPLLRDASTEAIAAISALDGEFVLVLQAARLVPEAALDTQAASEAAR